MKAVRVHQTGGAEQLKLEEIPAPEPAAGELLVRVAAAGVNFRDIYQRSGVIPPPQPPPFTPGLEGAGTVEAVGAGVTETAPGDIVAWGGHRGSYAELVTIPADRAVPVPPGLDVRDAASLLSQGLTAHYLSHDTFPLRSGQSCLVHAGAGGVGLLLIQIAKRRGAKVYTTVSTEEKAVLAKEAGADHVILYSREDFAVEIKRLTGGEGVDVVYDAVGRDTFQGSLDSLKVRGYLVLYGQASGLVPPLDLYELADRGSLFVTRPHLAHHIRTREELLKRADEVMGWVRSGELKVRIGHTYPLAEAARAHEDLAARRTTGKLLLIP